MNRQKQYGDDSTCIFPVNACSAAQLQTLDFMQGSVTSLEVNSGEVSYIEAQLYDL